MDLLRRVTVDQSACSDAKNSQPYTLENQGLEANNGDLEDDFPDFNWVIFRFQPLIFQGVSKWMKIEKNPWKFHHGKKESSHWGV